MATFDPHRPSGGQQGVPQAQPLPQATPLEPDQPVRPAQPMPQAQPLPQAQPVAPAQPAVPQAKPVPQPEPRAPQATPVAQPTTPVAQPTTPVAQPTTPVAQPTTATPQPVRPGQPAGKGPQPIVARPTATVGAKPITTTLRTDEESEEDREDITEVAVRNAPPWLISAAIHMVLLIVLGLMFLPQLFNRNVDILITTAEEDEEDIWAEELGQQLEIENMQKEVEDPTDALALADLPEVPDPLAAPQFEPILPDSLLKAPNVDTRIPGMALHGRQAGSKRGLLGRYGGTRKTEEAVMAGLLWLARNQLKNGSWSLAGPYTDGVPRDFDNPQAATAMALLAFQGAGNTTKEGRFRQNVALGWRWLLDQQDGNGNFYHEGAHNHHFYTQGQCAIAICELYAMTQDEKYKDPAVRAIDYCLKGQSPLGGWRYDPGGGSDVSVTGWIVMALQSARMAGLEVPEDNLNRITRFLDLVARQDGARYPYQKNEDARLSMTAEGLLMRQYLGWAQDDPRLVAGVEWITSENNLVDYGGAVNVYYWYYATQVAHHMEGEYWDRWNNVMRQEVPEHQVEQGREKGSWYTDQDQWAPHGGRLYMTCLSIYMLEVYYRHLPIYSNVYAELQGGDEGDDSTSVLKK